MLAAVGIAPDLDLLIGRHSGETHSVGAALLVATAAAMRRWPVARLRWKTWLAVFLAWMVHPLLDALAPDGTAPFGVMLLWPFSRDYVQFAFTPFLPISRRYWLDGFVVHTLTAVAREVLILAPAVAFAWVAGRGLGAGARRPAARSGLSREE